MVSPFVTEGNRVNYAGNKVFPPLEDVLEQGYSMEEFEGRVSSFVEDSYWGNIARINHRIFQSSVEYFTELGGLFTPLPLTTRMISSPGAVYGRETISYTTDTSPITLSWFGLPDNAFLSESSQIYLELALMQAGVNNVFSIYNSFRKEEADPTHLCEFHHIEYEGKVDQETNQQIAFGLIRRIVRDLLDHNLGDLEVFLFEDDVNKLRALAAQEELKVISFREALATLYEDTQDPKYKEFTMENFGAWEEIRLTELYGEMIGVREFPLLEVPFYHAPVEGSEVPVADCMDIIWAGYREILGSGQRIRSQDEAEYKAEVFDLPKEDYRPYLQTREHPSYVPSSGFGLGWERLIQGILKMPFIWSANPFPRVDGGLRP